jgi:CHASE2 domain-containing sensor protein
VLGGRIVSDGRGGSMPGVEALANAVNTILRLRFYSETPAVNEILYALLAAALTLGLLSLATRLILRIGSLVAVAVAIAVVGHVSYQGFLVYPPLTAELVSLASTATLALLWKQRRPLPHGRGSVS